jgi:hypothetical protein
MARQPQRVQSSSLSRFRDTLRHTTGFLWTSDRPIAETSTLLHKALTRKTSNLQTHALDRVATEIGKYASNIKQCVDRPLGLQEVKAPIIPK